MPLFSHNVRKIQGIADKNVDFMGSVNRPLEGTRTEIIALCTDCGT